MSRSITLQRVRERGGARGGLSQNHSRALFIPWQFSSRTSATNAAGVSSGSQIQDGISVLPPEVIWNPRYPNTFQGTRLGATDESPRFAIEHDFDALFIRLYGISPRYDRRREIGNQNREGLDTEPSGILCTNRNPSGPEGPAGEFADSSTLL